MEKVFIDMDGVLCDFVAGALKEFDAMHWYDRQPPKCLKFYELLNINQYQFWNTINKNPDFWNSLNPYSHVPELMDTLVEKFGIKKLAIATTPVKHEHCYAGKWKWYAKHIKPKWPIEFIPIVDKSILSRPGRLLIDDQDPNIEKWEKAGGHGLLFPQPWNNLYHERLDKSENSKWLHPGIHRESFYERIRSINEQQSMVQRFLARIRSKRT